MNHWVYLKPPLQEGEIKDLRADQAHHLIRVLRLAVGSSLVVCDGQGKARKGRLVTASPKKAQVLLEELIPVAAETELKVYLAQSLLKSYKMDYVMQKSVEIGAAGIIPLIVSRSVRRWSAKQGYKKIARWQTIIEEAAAQSHRTVLPQLFTPVTVDLLRNVIPSGSKILVCWEKEEKTTLKDVLKENEVLCPVVLAIGPEGGFAEEEVNLLKSWKSRTVSMGPRILRAETASLVALTIVLYQLGDLG